MENQSLVDQFCPAAHQSPVTGADYDAQSGAMVTGDTDGVVAITRKGETYPGLVFQASGPINGAVAVSPGGSLIAVGDEDGAIAVFNTWDGQCVFEDYKEEGGSERAMRAVSFNRENNQVACLSVDGVVRVFDIQNWTRVVNWSGFAGESLEFNSTGDRILAIDRLGQAKLLDMVSHEQIDLEMVPGGVRIARFTPDDQYAVTMGQGGIALIQLPEGRIVQSMTAQRAAGMLGITVSPEGDRVAAVTGRSVHIFSLPDLDLVESQRHGAADPTAAAIWDHRGVAVGGADGNLHRPGAKPSLDPTIAVAGFGDYRVSSHGTRVAIWTKDRMRRPFNVKRRFVELRIDRDGRLLCGLPDDGSGVCVFEAKSGRFLFNAGPETADTPKLEVGGPIVACMLARGGIRWYDLKNNSVFELPWVRTFALSGSGTWLAVVTPKGTVKVLDPTTGEEAIPDPEPLADVPISLVSFVNRSPDMLVMDEEGVMGLYDLAVSVMDQVPATGSDILDFNVAVDRLWGITGRRHAAVRFQEAENGTATVIYVDIQSGEVVSEVPGLLPYAWVDPETGDILQPARGCATLEYDMYGQEKRVLRALPEGQWVSFGPRGVLGASEKSGL